MDKCPKCGYVEPPAANPYGVAVGQVWIEKDRRATLPVLIVGIDGKKAVVVRGRNPDRGPKTKVRLDTFGQRFKLEADGGGRRGD